MVVFLTPLFLSNGSWLLYDDPRMSSASNLATIDGILVGLLKESIVESKDVNGARWHKFGVSPTDRLKGDVRTYVRDWGKANNRHVTVAFPTPFTMRLRDHTDTQKSRSGTSSPSEGGL